MSARGGASGATVTVVSGLALVGASTAAWTERAVTRTVGDVEVSETVATRGVEYARLGLLLGLAAAVAGILLLALSAAPRRVVGLAVALLGVAVLVDVGLGLVAATDAGGITPAPGFAVASGIGMVAGGILAARARRRAGLPPRFDIDGGEPADEWDAAVDPEEREP